MSDHDRFDEAPVSRRRFFQLSAATGAALALPGNAAAETTSEKFTAEYQYVLNHTPADHAVPTLVRFDDADGGTRVTYTADYDLGLPRVVGRLVAPLAARLNRRELKRTLGNLETRLSG